MDSAPYSAALSRECYMEALHAQKRFWVHGRWEWRPWFTADQRAQLIAHPLFGTPEFLLVSEERAREWLLLEACLGDYRRAMADKLVLADRFGVFNRLPEDLQP